MIHGGAPVGSLEFSASLNPLGTPDGVRAAVANARYDRYADLDAADAEAHLGRDAGVPADHVLLTAGATEGIRLAITVFAPRADRTIIVGPTYGEYARVAGHLGQRIVGVDASGPVFAPPIAHALEATRDGTCLLVICDPNNPTGQSLGSENLEAIVRASRGPVVIDQSFAPFANRQPSAADLLAMGKAILIRSLTKRLAIPGVRVGYVVAAPDTIRHLRARQDPWSPGAHAIAAARVAAWSLSASERATVGRWRDRLAALLVTLGLEPLSGDANFLLVRVGSGAEALVRRLADRSVAVRWCQSFGLPGHVRLAVRPPDEQDTLQGALARSFR